MQWWIVGRLFINYQKTGGKDYEKKVSIASLSGSYVRQPGGMLKL